MREITESKNSQVEVPAARWLLQRILSLLASFTRITRSVW
jgi:hypothetical protein